MELRPFHLALAVSDLEQAREFYAGVMGCETGRSDALWIDFNLYGHQLVCHAVESQPSAELPANIVDQKAVPVPHFGVVLNWAEWENLAARLRNHGVKFLIEPGIRFEGLVGEQATMFFADPAGNMLEFKAFRDPDQLFAS